MFRSLPPLHPGAELFVAVMDPRGTTAKRQKWGRFLPHQRANVDQVPLPFVNDMEPRVSGCSSPRLSDHLRCDSASRPGLTPV